ncbi:MAG: DUF4829 domain-containing protein [Clostridia bacterium]|nr:DUF4829 domain-containing protein [Clostridia bacterium]
MFAGLLGGYALKDNIKSTKMSAEQVVREHFKHWNDKNLTKLEETLTPDRKGITWEFNNLEYVKLLSIKEKPIKGQNNQKEFDVVFNIKFKNGSGSGLSNGRFKWSYKLKKDTERSPWLIYDWGV